MVCYHRVAITVFISMWRNYALVLATDPPSPPPSLASSPPPSLAPGTLSSSNPLQAPEQWCACPKAPPEIPPNEDNIGVGETCSKHTEENVWFTPIHVDDKLGNAVVRYRHCAVPHTLYIDTINGCPHAYTYMANPNPILRIKIDDMPTCTEFRTKAVPSSTNFRIFYGVSDSTSNKQDSSDPTYVCEGPSGHDVCPNAPYTLTFIILPG